jgi:hypothetical protein
MMRAHPREYKLQYSACTLLWPLLVNQSANVARAW